MKKYIIYIVDLFAFITLVSSCTEDIVIPDPEGPYTPEVPLPDTDTLEQPDPEIPTDDPADEPTEEPSEDPTEEPGDNPTDPLPGNGSVPAGMDGNWVQGTFSLTEFWNSDGSYAGKGTEQSNVFVIKPNGECEYYFIMTQRIYNCTTKVLNYRKGTVVFDEANGTFTFTPASGNYRGFYSCASSSNIDRAATPEELVPQTYHYTMEDRDGTPYMVVKFKPTDAYPSYFKKTIW